MSDYIDPFSEHSLYDLLASDVPVGESTEYMGFHQVVQHDDGRFAAQLDGHAGRVEVFDPDEYDDVLELVDDLNDLVARYQEYEYQDDREALVGWAGKIMTSDEERAESNPETHIHIPDDPAPVDAH